MTPEAITFEAGDGWPLEGDLYRGKDPKMALLISGGTGFPRRFYRHVAAWLAAEGAVVLTFDYRGIGGSAHGDPARRDIEYRDWGRYDQVAAVEALEAAAPGLPINHIAHSVGGHFIGLMPNHAKIRRHAFVAVGSGHWRRHKPHYIPTAMYFWWVLGAWSLMRHGYVKPGGGWGGEALPHVVFTTWRRWAHRRDYLAGDIASVFGAHHYEDVRAPIRTWLFSDDPIATERAAPGILDNYPNARKDFERIAPSDVGLRRIGHEGAFRPGREAIWRRWFDWLTA
ncbi:MAG: alpha/beta hydrolase [Pseudomonadota bacterium]